MPKLKIFTTLFVSEYIKQIDLFLSQMTRNQFADIPYYNSFIEICTSLKFQEEHFDLPINYYNVLWNLVLKMHNLKLIDSRMQSYFRLKNFKNIHADFKIENWRKNIKEMQILQNEIKETLENMGILTYYLTTPMEVTEASMEYLILFCGYDGTYGPDRLQLLHKLVTTNIKKFTILNEKKHL